MRINIDDTYYLSEYTPADREAIVEHINDKDIYDNTLRIPHPYSLKDADEFIAFTQNATKEFGHPINWAIRDQTGAPIGGMGYVEFVPNSHRVEIGYWLGKKYWGRGIVPKAVEAFCRFSREKFGFIRFTAQVFIDNPRSEKVLLKSGFQLEGILRKHYKKDGKIFDGKLFARLME